MTGFFTILFRRIQYNKKNNFGDNFGDNINETQIKILKCLYKAPKLSAKKIAEEFELTTRAVEQNLKSLKERGLIIREGPAKGGHWVVAEEVKNKLKVNS